MLFWQVRHMYTVNDMINESQDVLSCAGGHSLDVTCKQHALTTSILCVSIDPTGQPPRWFRPALSSQTPLTSSPGQGFRNASGHGKSGTAGAVAEVTWESCRVRLVQVENWPATARLQLQCHVDQYPPAPCPLCSPHPYPDISSNHPHAHNVDNHQSLACRCSPEWVCKTEYSSGSFRTELFQTVGSVSERGCLAFLVWVRRVTDLPAYTRILPPYAFCCQNMSLLVSHARVADATL